MIRLTRKKICKAIKDKTGLSVGLYQSDGCFHFFSDDEETGRELSRKYSSTVYVCRVSHLSLDQWVEYFESIWAGQ